VPPPPEDEDDDELAAYNRHLARLAGAGPGVSGALLRYRVIANVVGVVLVVFILIAVPVRYLAGEPRMSRRSARSTASSTSSTSSRRWTCPDGPAGPVLRTLGVMLAGTVPFLSFYVERRTTRSVRAA
jgi:hypothetical protein